MKFRLGAASLLLFVLSLVFLLILTLFEPLLSGLSLYVERIISVVLLIVPGLIGLILGGMSLRREELPRWVAILGIFLNGLFTLFHICVLSLAG